jgi:hypothetical protein
VEEKIAFGKGRLDLFPAGEEGNVWKSIPEEFVGPVFHVARPEAHLGVDLMPPEKLHHAKVMGDVADVETLPSVAEENTGTLTGRDRRESGEAGREGGGEGLVEKVTSVHGQI